ncbi:hypothetical protein QQS21_011968 [Conoideocrella luteorostrata]|uniref:Uncharacterized protein n=1 Tax=Conoideocrella luteorostrata TaxID=1105319 RepID=A0AAJ0CEF0_9HYPO|nr:hypothetical protein QQS21_011968 [Conoideocrella luteorostrata]
MKLTHWSLILGSALLQMAAAAPSLSENSGAKLQSRIVIPKQDLENEHIDKDGLEGKDIKGIKHTYGSESKRAIADAVIWLKNKKRAISKGLDTDKVPTSNSGDQKGSQSNEKPQRVNSKKTKGFGRLNEGQAYNSFLDKGGIADAVIWPNDRKRAIPDGPVKPAGNEANKTDIQKFKFTPPNTAVKDFKDVDLKEYFAPPNPTDIKSRVEAKLKEVKEDINKQQGKKDEDSEPKEQKDNPKGQKDDPKGQKDDPKVQEDDPKEQKDNPKEQKDNLKEQKDNPNELYNRADDKDCQGSLRQEYKFTKDYNSYLQSLGISGGATINGWGQSASVSGNYLNQAKFSKESLTYVAFLDIEKQSESRSGFEFNKARYKQGYFAQDFGNRWIHGFKTGGKMIARITFTTKDSTKSTDLKAHAEAALTYLDVNAEVKGDIAKDMKEVNNHTNADVSVFYQGNLGVFMENSGQAHQESLSGSAGEVLLQVRSWADKFKSSACKHDYAYGLILDEYETVPGFRDLEGNPKVPDYDKAHLWSLEILAQIVKVEELKQFLSSVSHLDDGKKGEMKQAAIKAIGESKDWVKLVAQNPEKADEEAIKLMERLNTDFFAKYGTYVKDATNVGRCLFNIKSCKEKNSD